MAWNLKTISDLQTKASCIRNICILGHVDHGKTTLADALIASNGIISQRMAGQMRYMDSREDEQIRGITMKSSAISLHHRSHLVNLIDSPGHVDFSSEVSTAVRLCDGAIVVIDVVEGVSAQSYAVLRQAWAEHIKPVLVLNKIDRLMTELKLTPSEAYVHLHRIIEQVNAVTSELYTADVMFKTAQEVESEEEDAQATIKDKVYDWALNIDEAADSNIYFSPERGNVIFASAVDGWAFSINHFAGVLSTKLSMNANVLRRTLWGDFYLNGKTKRIMKGAHVKGKTPLFVQLVLNNVWAVYDAILINRDKEKSEKIVSSLKLKVSVRDSRHNDPRVYLKSVMTQWLPLSSAVLDMVVDKLPSPLDIAEERVNSLLTNHSQTLNHVPSQTENLKNAFLTCQSSSDVPVIAYISKMFPVDRSLLPQYRQRPLTADELKERHAQARQRLSEKHMKTQDQSKESSTMHENSSSKYLSEGQSHTQPPESDQVFLAFARIFSGILHKGQRLFVLGPKHNPASLLDEYDSAELLNSSSSANLPSHVSICTIDDLLICMGRELESIQSVAAGNVIAIRGLEEHIIKSGTISTTLFCPSFSDMYFDAAAIVSVAIEPVYASDMKRLVDGLRLLNQADPCVRVYLRETGEHVIVTAGEVHLDRCIRDLEERYAKVKLNVSAPIVPFRETVIEPPKFDMVKEVIDNTQNKCQIQTEQNNEKSGIVDVYTSNKKHSIQIRALPLPAKIVQVLVENNEIIKKLEKFAKSKSTTSKVSSKDLQLSAELLHDVTVFKEKLKNAFSTAGDLDVDAVDKILSFGPRHNGPSILLNNIKEYSMNVWSCLNNTVLDISGAGIVNGFQLATLAGPLCGEPLMGVCFVIEKWQYSESNTIAANKDEAITKNFQNGTDTNEIESKKLDSNHIGIDKLQVEHKNKEPLIETDYSSEKSVNNGENFQKDNDIVVLLCENNHCDHSIANCDKNHSGVHEPETDLAEKYENLEICQNIKNENKSTDEVESKMEVLETEELLKFNKLGIEGDTQNSTNDISKKHIDGSTEGRKMNRIRTLSYRDDVSDSDTEDETDNEYRFGEMSGQLMSCVKVGCHRAFKLQPVRLMAAMYECQIQATAEVLGKLYAVLNKRFGRILSEELREGTQMFTVVATLPVIESFGFAEEIRKKTSGLASPQLKFSHWQVIDVNPYWVPTTDEEYAHFGEKADCENRARNYMNGIRRRKGLTVDEKIVEHAEKQRTLKKNK